MRLTAIHRNFRRDERGSAGAMFGLLLIPAMGVVGLAIDVGRVINERTRLQALTDMAAINGARSSNTTDASRAAAARASLEAHGENTQPTTPTPLADWCAANNVATGNCSSANADYIKYVAGINAANAALPTAVATNGLVTVTASGSVKASFAHLFGVPTFNFEVESKATAASGKQLELSMMVDLTGSMGGYRNGQTKIAALKDAADDLLEIIMPGNTNPTNVRVAVAPFADYVNAGAYAAAATGMPSSGTYAPISNLKKTRQGKTNHVRYTGATGNSAGSQAGATSSSGVLNAAGASAPSSSGGAGGSFDNGYCANPTSNVTADVYTTSGYKWGQRISVDDYNDTDYDGPPPPGFLKAGSGSNQIRDIDDYETWGWDSDGLKSSGYFVPLLNSDAGLTITRRTMRYCIDTWDGRFGKTSGSCSTWSADKTANVGVYVENDDGSNPTTSGQVVKAASSSDGGYWRIDKIKTTNNAGTTYELRYVWRTTGYYIPVFDSLSTSTVNSGCESSAPAGQALSPLITCVTERTGTEAYTDASPGTSPVGAFNHGQSGIDNYSEDGKCMVSGRELPAIIPLTNDKQTLASFFLNATIGGATPGHIGTAWAWYMLSPSWSSVFPSSSMPTAYNQPNVIKAAVLMTDGEYNIHYASATSRDQALALCANMKAAGITVYTVGFGFSASSTPSATGTAEQRAKDLMIQCASPGNKYFFPYDGAQLRQDFQNIGNQLMGQMTSTEPKLSN